MSKKILLLYAAPDSGHAQVARSLVQAIKKQNGWPAVEDHVVRCFPTLGPWFLRLYRWMLLYHAGLWGHLHDNPDYYRLVRRAEEALCGQDVFKVLAMVNKHRPDAVIATHALPLRFLAAVKSKGRMKIPLFAVTTDFWAHRYWASKAVDGYFASSSKAADDLVRHGVDAGKILLTGIPLRPEFAEPASKWDSRRRLGLDPARKTALVLGGSYGIMPFRELLDAAILETSNSLSFPRKPFVSPRLGGSQASGLGRESRPVGKLDPRLRAGDEKREFLTETLETAATPLTGKWHWLFVFGSNQEALGRAKRQVKGSGANGIRLLGFRRDMAGLMAASDLLITKAGALTISEALAFGLPMIICRPIPGQEEGNAAFLAKSGAAVRADEAEDVVKEADRLFHCPALLAKMRHAARRLARPQAAHQIAQELKRMMK
ncbi:MAG: glycosyltransferase [Elusimicrobia bacterium]|nr:glycosyltransferase [Elusimicrobiota bacterium]